MQKYSILLSFYVGITLIFLVVLGLPHSINAHSGRTDSFGCHNCYTSYCYGEYHCHNGGTGGSVGFYSPPKPVYDFPDVTASWEFIPSIEGTFDIKVKLNDPNPSQYSAVLSRFAGGDPGPNADFYSNKFFYSNIQTGKWYLNVKKEINGYWSTIAYYEIDVPEWYPPPTPTNVTLSTNFIEDDSPDNNLSSTLVILFMLGIGYGLWKLFNI